MAKFLDTQGVSNELAQIIKGAKDKLIIISPYLQIEGKFKELLEDQDKLKLEIRIIYRENKLQHQENNWLNSLTSVKTSICKTLHAKCYLNENKALITSMNFYQFSQINNDEMGIVVSRSEDPELYADINEEVNRLKRRSEEIRVTVQKIVSKEDSNSKNPKNGFCIRCGADIKLNQEKPFCLDCYNEWKKYSNDEYEEKLCHSCGTKHVTSMKKPFCLKCFKKLNPK